MNSVTGGSRRGSTTSAVSHSETSPHPQHGRWFSSPYESAVMAVYSTSPPGRRPSPTPSSYTPNPPHRPPVVPQRPASARQEGRQPPRSFHIGIRPNSAKVGGGIITPTNVGYNTNAAVLPTTTMGTPNLTHQHHIPPRRTSISSSIARCDTPSEFTAAADSYLRRRPTASEEDVIAPSPTSGGDRHQSYIDNIMRRIGMGGGGGHGSGNPTPETSPQPPINNKSIYGGLRANTRLSMETSPTRPQSGASDQGGLSTSGRGGGVYDSSNSWRVRPPTTTNSCRPASSSVRLLMMTPTVDDDKHIADTLQSEDVATAATQPPPSPRPSVPRSAQAVEAIERSPTPTIHSNDAFKDVPPPVSSKPSLPNPQEPVENSPAQSSLPTNNNIDIDVEKSIDQPVVQEEPPVLSAPTRPNMDGYYHYFEGVNKVAPTSPAATPAASTDGYYGYFNALPTLPKLEASPRVPTPTAPNANTVDVVQPRVAVAQDIEPDTQHITEGVVQEEPPVLSAPTRPNMDGYYHYFEGVNKVAPTGPGATPAASTDGYYGYFNALPTLPKLEASPRVPTPTAPVVAADVSGSEVTGYYHYFNSINATSQQQPTATYPATTEPLHDGYYHYFHTLSTTTPQVQLHGDGVVDTNEEDPIQRHTRSISSMRKERPPSAATTHTNKATPSSSSSSTTAVPVAGTPTATAQCDAMLLVESEKSLQSGVLQELNRGNVCVPTKIDNNNNTMITTSTETSTIALIEDVDDVEGVECTTTRLRMVVMDESHYTSQLSLEQRDAALLASLLELQEDEHSIRSNILLEECGVDLVEKCEDQEGLNREVIEALEITSMDTRLVPAWGQIRLETVDDLQHLEYEDRAFIDTKASEELIRLLTGEWECDGRQIIKDDEKEDRRLLARIDASEVVEAARHRSQVDERASELAMGITKAAIQEEERVIAASMAAKELDEERRKVLRTLHTHFNNNNVDDHDPSRSPSPHYPSTSTTPEGAGGGEQYMDIIDDDDWAALVALAAHRAALDSKHHAASNECEKDYVAISASINNNTASPIRGEGELDACEDAGQEMPEWVQRRLLPDNLKPLPEYHTNLDVIAQRPASPATGPKYQDADGAPPASHKASYLDSVADAALVAKSGLAPPHPLPPAPPQSEMPPKPTPPNTGININDAAAIGNPQHILLGVLSAISQQQAPSITTTTTAHNDGDTTVLGSRSSTPLLDFLAHQPGYGKHKPYVPIHTTTKATTSPHKSTPTPPAAAAPKSINMTPPQPRQQDESVGTSDDHSTRDEATCVRPKQHTIATNTEEGELAAAAAPTTKVVDARPLSARSKEDREKWMSGMLDRALLPAAAPIPKINNNSTNDHIVDIHINEDDLTIKALFKIRQAVLQVVVDEEDDNRFLLDDAQLRIRKEIISNRRDAIAALGPQCDDYSQHQLQQ